MSLVSESEQNRINQLEDSKFKGSEYVKCIFCGKDNYKKWCVSEGFKIVKCSCGMQYPNPRLSMDEILGLYNGQVISGINDYLEVEEDNKKDFTRRLKLIEKFKPTGKMLDVGCNIGSLGEVASKRGWKYKGIDVNKEAIDIAKHKGVDCSTQDFFSLNEKFDLIVMNDLIEHLPNPEKALNKAYSLLNKEGILYISTPKGNSFMSHFSKGKWLHRKPQQHLYIFTSEIIKKLLENEGFKIEYLSTIGRIRSFMVMIKKAGSYSKIISGLSNLIIPKFIKNISFSINLKDEMHIIARKNGR